MGIDADGGSGDSGTSTADAGPPADSGTPSLDAGPSHDAGPPTDGGIRDAGIPDAGVDGGHPYQRFLDAAALAMCQRLSTCRVVSDGGQADCQAMFRKRYASGGGLFGEGLWRERAVLQGSAVFDESLADACLNEIRRVPCRGDDVYLGDRGCSALVHAIAIDGGSCTSRVDCLDNGTCNGMACNRRCSPGGGPGEGCLAGGICSGTLACIGSQCIDEPDAGTACTVAAGCGARLACVGGRCVPRAAIGDSCASIPCGSDGWCNAQQCVAKEQDGSACTSNSQCRSGRCAAGTCVALGSIGVACASSAGCEPGLSCIRGGCWQRGAEATPCVAAFDCAYPLECDQVTRRCAFPSAAALTGQTCTPTAKCRASADICRNPVVAADGGVGTSGLCGPGQPGDACRRHDDCSIGQFCDAGACATGATDTPCTTSASCPSTHFCPNGRCAPRAMTGAACNGFVRGACLNDGEHCTSGQCAPMPSLGEPCTDICRIPGVCVAGRCVHAGRTGEPCATNPLTCLDGECVDTGAGVRTCSAPLAAGEPCSRDELCASGVCDNPAQLRGTCAACP